MMFACLALSLALAFLVVPAAAGDYPVHTMPDPSITPGATLEDVTAEEVCAADFLKSQPPVEHDVMLEAYRRYGLTGPHTGFCSRKHGCQLDHLVPQNLGGSNELRNLWPEPNDGPYNAHMKNRLEQRLHDLVCAGKLGLGHAQRAIALDWIAAYLHFVEGKK